MKWLLLVAIAVVSGCAKLPDVGTGGTSKRLIFTLTVQGEIKSNYVYVIALRPSQELNPTTQGPIPVIAPPWGNGFVAGNCTHFVRWDPAQSPRYILYQFRDTNLIDFFQLGVPINYVDVTPGGKVLKFELNLDQIAPVNPELIQSVQVNFLTMDRVPSGTGGTKNWDALGDGRLPSEINEYITIPLRTSGVYDNTRFGDLEPSNDAPDPDLEITDFEVEVRLQ
ncbi:MAG TPA: hypothetical protein PKA27_09780 [Fimbriimonadaceae bacterium]|nr:hypothetical protein [Fimbriimonadaceae bacterium]